MLKPCHRIAEPGLSRVVVRVPVSVMFSGDHLCIAARMPLLTLASLGCLALTCTDCFALFDFHAGLSRVGEFGSRIANACKLWLLHEDEELGGRNAMRASCFYLVKHVFHSEGCDRHAHLHYGTCHV